MGELFGGGSAKRAAREQAAATRDAARRASIQAGYQAEAAAQQMTLAQDQRAAQAAANDLLSTPMESAEVDLAADADVADEDDLLTRRRSTRQTYQNERRAGLSVR